MIFDEFLSFIGVALLLFQTSSGFQLFCAGLGLSLRVTDGRISLEGDGVYYLGPHIPTCSSFQINMCCLRGRLHLGLGARERLKKPE